MNLRAGAAGLALAIIASCGAAHARAGESQSDAATFASDMISLADLLAKHHYEPPARQQVVLIAARALYKARDLTPPADLSDRCSAATSEHEMHAILKAACGEKFVIDGETRSAVAQALEACVPGGLQLLSKKADVAQRQLAENRYVGVGIATRLDDQREMQVASIMPNGPMDRAGVREGTVVRTIDGWATKSQRIEECVERLRGPEGTSVELMIRRPGSDQDEPLTLIRGVVPQTLLESTIEEEGGRRIAVLTLKQLGGSVPHELGKLAEKERDLDGIVLDLREVQGPAHYAILLADQFLDGGEMGCVCKRDQKTPLRAEAGELFADVPIAIAADPSSAGSAGWLATVLMERKRAKVFGQHGDRPNLDFDSFALRSGTQAAAFATRLLESPGSSRTLVVSETTQKTPPETVSAKHFSERPPIWPTPPKSPTDVARQVFNGMARQVIASQPDRGTYGFDRGPVVIAKEYLRSLPARKK
ncbi:putative CtpA-like serine protease [Caulifigura coniformis]|uniref:Putative CtpA-like serine protease n=1 Tax=Caulifigura coniformis TaxID=2527983 RepID=A0A517SFW4_9PLAN|nr:S41 family peptidase [Caulifigura coniformis]QDT55018.1 putative CtpA-like serine protease [Caulifigura coniformis]